MSRLEGISGLEGEKSLFWESLEVVFRWWKFIFVCVTIVCLITAVTVFLLPKWYRASATVLPPERGAMDMNLSSVFRGGIPFLGGDLAIPFAASPSDVLAAVAQSDAVLLGVISELSLAGVYGISSTETLLKVVRGGLLVKTSTEGIVQISYEDKDPKRAYEVVQSVLANLDRVNQRRGSTKARATRLFVEGRLQETEKNLQAARDSLKAFQLTNRALDLDEQTKALIASAATVKAQVVSDRIALATLKRELSETHPEVQKLEGKIASTEHELKRLEERGSKGSFMGVAMAALPGLTQELAIRIRDVAIQEKLFELLIEQYEQAKIQEAKDTPTISVLDYPRIPEYKIRPKRLKLILTAFFISLFVALGMVFAREYFERMRTADPSRYQMVTSLASRIRAELVSPFRKNSKGADGQS
ncbi:MAG: Wzz/FepE/Etk N-terminal domain-containing protein [candidate division Zixibacteria bacterium]|nr:Wzz/FepE/Etk N-terminal domain-containing protein [candidate division Zixibacteria bacterium]MCI0595800.1 Wzz/FepE/Etk N-terminal domain-containing protein [candidate division Zixibacteria bacterium]